MTTSLQLVLANPEVNRLFTRKLPDGSNFYQALLHKVSSLVRRCENKQAYALVTLKNVQEMILSLTSEFDDEIDKFEGLLEKKKHLKDKVFHFEKRFKQEVSFDNSVAAALVELFEIYDRLVSILKILRTARCFVNDDDYFNNLRRYFKSINRVLSHLLLIPLNHLKTLTFTDVMETPQEDLDYHALLEAMSSSLAPRLPEKIRNPILLRLKKHNEAMFSATHNQEVL
jgi:hypothetical protein